MNKRSRATVVAAIGAVGALTLAACGGGGGGADDRTLELWDSWSQYDASSPYGQLLSTCEEETGITIERTQEAELSSKLLQAASSGSTPDLVVLDNPLVAQFAETGLLVPNSESGLDTSGMMDNVLAAGQFEGETYGASIGANSLALFYNKDMFDEAGTAPPTTWQELTSAAAELTHGDVRGLGFSAAASEEGTFQFLPFFWGAGADLADLESPEAAAALTLWTDLVDSGSASQSNLNATQQDVRDEFLAGKLAMMVNGTWQLASLDEDGISYGVVPLPAQDGGTAASPLGGEFMEIVVGDRQELAAEFSQCLVKPANLKVWTEGQTYIQPYADEAAAQAAENPALEPWVEAVSAAQGRTADLGTAYPQTSEALWTAVQEALSGQKSPEQALADAAAAAAAE